MASDPLFNINDLNANLYHKIKVLDKTRVYRLQLHYLKDFLTTCRFAIEQETGLQEFLKTTPPYFLAEPHVYSLQDLVQVKMGELSEKLKDLVQAALAHVKDCVGKALIVVFFFFFLLREEDTLSPHLVLKGPLRLPYFNLCPQKPRLLQKPIRFKGSCSLMSLGLRRYAPKYPFLVSAMAGQSNQMCSADSSSSPQSLHSLLRLRPTFKRKRRISRQQYIAAWHFSDAIYDSNILPPGPERKIGIIFEMFFQKAASFNSMCLFDGQSEVEEQIWQQPFSVLNLLLKFAEPSSKLTHYSLIVPQLSVDGRHYERTECTRTTELGSLSSQWVARHTPSGRNVYYTLPAASNTIPLCQGRGFMCEECKKSEVIFPWQLTKVHRCPNCGNCFHLSCYTPKTQCGRCSRLHTRRKNSIMTVD
ncbi:hypothetical protein J6590_078256 [Homalodisca vitripennis]|nr:hypothetical protein J6590_078256 [Homalodisca vitripennis]